MLRASLGKVVHTVQRAGTFAAKVSPQELHKFSNRIILYLEGCLIFPFNILQYFSLRRRCVSLQGKMQRLSEHNLATLYLETLKFIADLLLLVTIPDTIPS